MQLYEELYQEYYNDESKLVKGEKYVAHFIIYLLSKIGRYYISDVDCQKVHVLGTPEELQAFIDI